MAHELEIVNGQAQRAYSGDVPWHGLGVKVGDNLTPQEMMQAAGLDWTVSKHPMYVTDGILVPGKKALLRDSDNTVLDVVGDDWIPVQNEFGLAEDKIIVAAKVSNVPCKIPWVPM